MKNKIQNSSCFVWTGVGLKVLWVKSDKIALYFWDIKYDGFVVTNLFASYVILGGLYSTLN